MNTYNDDLRSNVVNSLQSQEIDQKKMTAHLNANMFSLYFAQGARITAGDKLEIATGVLSEKQWVREQAVNNANVATNLLMSANQEKKYVDLSVTNSAVCAANVQVAANAIVKLASDVGGIYSIALAADFDTEISGEYEKAYKHINTTAYNAELASQQAMEMAIATAEVSSTTVANTANATNVAVDNLLKVVTAEFEKVSELVAADNAALAIASKQEKGTEGKLQDVNVEYMATNSAYASTNKELNLNLNVFDGYVIDSDKISSSDFYVGFNLLRSPFPPDDAADGNKKKNPPIATNYYIMVVKDQKKSTFSITEAERLKKRFGPDDHRVLPVKAGSELNFENFKSPQPKEKLTALQETFDIFTDVSIYDLCDSDNDQIQQGKKYVVFVMGAYDELYKEEVNNYENFLSAASPSFALTYALESPDSKYFAPKYKYKHSESYDVLQHALVDITEIINIYEPASSEERKILEVDFTPQLKSLEELLKTIKTEKEIKLLKDGEIDLKSLKDAQPQIKNELPKFKQKKSESYEVLQHALVDVTEIINIYEPASAAKRKTLDINLIPQLKSLEELLKTVKTKTKISLLNDGKVELKELKDAQAQIKMELPNFEHPVLISQSFQFEIRQDANRGLNPEYRCMFLANDSKLVGNMLRADELLTFESETSKFKAIDEKYQPKLDLATLDLDLHKNFRDLAVLVKKELITFIRLPLEERVRLEKELLSKILKWKKKLDSFIPDHGWFEKLVDKIIVKDVEELITTIQFFIIKMESKIASNNATLQDLVSQKNEDMSLINLVKEEKVGLFFNTEVAEQVPAGNYYTPNFIRNKKLSPAPVKAAAKDKSTKDDLHKPQIIEIWEVVFTPDKTDNYGNPLIKGNKYVPVVLTVTKSPDLAYQYTDSISDYAHTAPIKISMDLPNNTNLN